MALYITHRWCSEKKVLGLQLYQKETPKQVFPCEIWEIFKNIYFEGQGI